MWGVLIYPSAQHTVRPHQVSAAIVITFTKLVANKELCIAIGKLGW